jgi:hypothetical protein
MHHASGGHVRPTVPHQSSVGLQQNYINHLLWNILNKYYIAYFDNIFIYSNSKAEHYEYVRKMVKRLLNAGLQIDIRKYEFEAIKTKYLGIMVTPGGIEINPAKI